jgi:hypothetical protein
VRVGAPLTDVGFAELADVNALSTLADLRASAMSAFVPEVVTMTISDAAMR